MSIKKTLVITSVVLNAVLVLSAVVLVGFSLTGCYTPNFVPPDFSPRQNDILRHTYGTIAKHQPRPNDYIVKSVSENGSSITIAMWPVRSMTTGRYHIGRFLLSRTLYIDDSDACMIFVFDKSYNLLEATNNWHEPCKELK
jgi:hypothetical protein